MLEQGTLVALIFGSIGLAFGGAYGLDAILKRSFTENLKEYHKQSREALLLVVKKLGNELLKLKKQGQGDIDEILERELDKFIKSWEDYKYNIRGSYEDLLKSRGHIFYGFLLASLGYTLILFQPEAAIFNIKAESLANFAFIGSIIILLLFGIKYFDLKKRIAKENYNKK